MADAAVADLVPVAGTRAACAAVGCAQASWYRRHRHSPLPPRPERFRTGTGTSPAPWPRRSGSRSSMCCTAAGSPTPPIMCTQPAFTIERRQPK